MSRHETEERVYKISGPKRVLYNQYRKLTGMGFVCTNNKYTQTYEIKVSARDFARMDRLCGHYRRRGCKVTATDAKFTRSTSYRKDFFSTYPACNGKYRCVYCGRWISAKKITVDHLIPVHAARKPGIQKKLKRMGCNGVNDVKNLVPACASCNSRKSAKMGIWLIKGRLGKKSWFWPWLKAMRLVFILSFILICISIYKNRIFPEFNDFISDILSYFAHIQA